MTLLLIRHGETALNVARRLQPPDTPLSARGLAQAAALARRLARTGLAGIVSSDLARARMTAAAVAGACALPLEVTPLLQERNFGDLRGRCYDDLGYDPLAMVEAPAGGESRADFSRRVEAVFAHLLERRRRLGGALAVVTHGLVIRAWLDLGLIQLGRQPRPARLANTSVTIVAAEAPHRVSLLDCTAHLSGGAGEDSRSLSGG